MPTTRRSSPSRSKGASPSRSKGASPSRSKGASPSRSKGASPSRSKGASLSRSKGASPARRKVTPTRNKNESASRSRSRSRSRGRKSSPAKQSSTPSRYSDKVAKLLEKEKKESAKFIEEVKKEVIDTNSSAGRRSSSRISSVAVSRREENAKFIEEMKRRIQVMEEEKQSPSRRITRSEDVLDSRGLSRRTRRGSPTPQVSRVQESSSVITTSHSERHFGGAPGTFLLLFLLPLTVYYLTFNCYEGHTHGKQKEKQPKSKDEMVRCSIFNMPLVPPLCSLFDMEGALIFLGWFFFQAFLAILPVGHVVDGRKLATGERLKYRCNGFIALIVSLALFAGMTYMGCPVGRVYNKFPQIMTAGTVFSFVLSAFLYIKSRWVSESKLAPGGNTGNFIYDFFIGRELNPRIGSFDLKFFCELRPGLIGWAVLNLVFVLKAYKETGSLPPALVMVAFFQILYVADALYFEDAILTTMDIIHDGFGFMLVFGDLVWVPFMYCLQPRFLAMYPLQLPWYCLSVISLLNLLGYMVFRKSNSQKNDFRKNPYSPAFEGIETIKTPTGKSLLASGWWGLCRKPNYLGDLMMAFAWSLFCGVNYLIPYFYPLYFTVLLIHRERRDDAICKEKYGTCWDRYCKKVPYRIFPYIY